MLCVRRPYEVQTVILIDQVFYVFGLRNTRKECISNMLGCAEDTSKNFVECDLGPDVPKWE
jgi:hypothetical protein